MVTLLAVVSAILLVPAAGTLLTRNCTKPVGAVDPPVTVAVRVTVTGAAGVTVTLVGEEVLVVATRLVVEVLAASEPEPSGVTRFQSVARLLRSTLPQPVAKS